MIKYGTFAMFQNITTDEIKEIALADESELEKYGEDPNWKRVGEEDSDSEEPTEAETKEL